MRILLITDPDVTDGLLSRLFAHGYTVERVFADTIVDRLKSNLDIFAVADAAVINVTGVFTPESESAAAWMDRAAAIARAIRELPAWCAMPDGRKWNRIPIIVPGGEHGIALDDVEVVRGRRFGDVSGKEYADVINAIDARVEAYHARLIDQYDDMGLMITEDHGRLRIGPALAARDRDDLESEFYYGRADRRDRTKWATVSRDAIGITYEAELFEALINKREVTEAELQAFFEEHPHFLTVRMWSRAIPHPRLPQDGREVLVPDFVLAPIVAERDARDSDWQVLELKKPKERVLTSVDGRATLSRKVAGALQQLREYREYMEDPRNTAHVENALGFAIRRPKLAVLIGRRAGLDLDELDKVQERERVDIVTYDEILERQRALLR